MGSDRQLRGNNGHRDRKWYGKSCGSSGRNSCGSAGVPAKGMLFFLGFVAVDKQNSLPVLVLAIKKLDFFLPCAGHVTSKQLALCLQTPAKLML